MLFLLTFGPVVVVMTNCIKLSLFYLIIPIKFMFFLFLRASGTADLSNRNNYEVETKSFHTKENEGGLQSFQRKFSEILRKPISLTRWV